MVRSGMRSLARYDRFHEERQLRIGVLALQGAFREHVDHAAAPRGGGAEVRLAVISTASTGSCIPGGESTTIMRLAALYGLDDAIRSFGRSRPRHLRRDDRSSDRAHLRACADPRRSTGTPTAARSPASRPTSTSWASRARCTACSSGPRASATSATTSRCSRDTTASPCCSVTATCSSPRSIRS